jgi:hypothetical protein
VQELPRQRRRSRGLRWWIEHVGSPMPHFSEQADDHFISAERNAAHLRSLQRRHDDIHISSQCLTVAWRRVTTTPSRPALSLAANLTPAETVRDGNDDHGQAPGRTLHLRRITGGRRDPRAPERPPPVRRSWLPLPAPGLSPVHPPGGRHYPAARDRVRLDVRSQGARHRGARRRGPLPRAARCTSARTCGDVMQAAASHA